MSTETYTYHRFLDEAGDTTFYGKGKVPVVGNEGVSKCFILGMVSFKEPLDNVRAKVNSLQHEIASVSYFSSVPSVVKRVERTGYYLHARDDIPEIRLKAFELIKSLDCSFEAIVARKRQDIYEKKHNGKESEFYADLLSHLLKNKLNKYEKLVLNIAHRGNCTTHTNLQKGLEKAFNLATKKDPLKDHDCEVVFNVQYPTSEPLLNITDYLCWAIQRVFERGETRFYDYISEKISLVIDLYDYAKYPNSGNYYNKKNLLTEANKL